MSEPAALTLADEYGLTPSQLELVRTQCVGPEAPDDILRLHMHLCKNYGFDPMGNMLVWQKRHDRRTNKDRWTKITTIDGFRSISTDAGEFEGRVGPHYSGEGETWVQKDADGKPLYDENGVLRRIWVEAWADRNRPPRFARVGIRRKNFPDPLFTVCDYHSYVQMYNDKPSNLWATMPEVMLAKCAEAAALRAAFPKKLAGLYVGEEMMQADNAPRTVTALASPSGPKALPSPVDAAQPAKTATPPENRPERAANGRWEMSAKQHGLLRAVEDAAGFGGKGEADRERRIAWYRKTLCAPKVSSARDFTAEQYEVILRALNALVDRRNAEAGA